MNKNKTNKTIGILTGGGDCPGLNAAIRSLVKCSEQLGIHVKGVKKSFNGLWDEDGEIFDLTSKQVDDIQFDGGTILQTCNSGSPFHKNSKQDQNKIIEAVKNKLKKHNIDVLVVIGGDGTQTIAAEFNQVGVPIVGIPKTIDNDLEATELTIGFQTAVQIAADSLHRLQASAESHERVMILEVMGRDSGHIALHAGIAGYAHGILVPEIPYDPSIVAKMIDDRRKSGKHFSTIVIAEGAFAKEHKRTMFQTASGDKVLRGASHELAQLLHEETGLKMRSTILGYIQRGGAPCIQDAILANRYASEAIERIAAGRHGFIVSMTDDMMREIRFDEIKGKRRKIGPKDPYLKVARAHGICLGE